MDMPAAELTSPPLSPTGIFLPGLLCASPLSLLSPTFLAQSFLPGWFLEFTLRQIIIERWSYLEACSRQLFRNARGWETKPGVNCWKGIIAWHLQAILVLFPSWCMTVPTARVGHRLIMPIASLHFSANTKVPREPRDTLPCPRTGSFPAMHG